MINKVVLIDDDYSTNLYHEIILNDADIVNEIIVSTDVDDAIENIKNQSTPADIIFLDINMPIKSGWEFLEEYNKIEKSKRANRLVVLSTTKIPEEIIAANDHELIDAFYTKPLTIEMVEEIADIKS